jgi:hypothetical protein
MGREDVYSLRYFLTEVGRAIPVIIDWIVPSPLICIYINTSFCLFICHGVIFQICHRIQKPIDPPFGARPAHP